MHASYASNRDLPQNIASPSIFQCRLPIQIDLKPFSPAIGFKHEVLTMRVENLAEDMGAYNGGAVVLLLLSELANSQVLRHLEDQLYQDTSTDPPAHERWRHRWCWPRLRASPLMPCPLRLVPCGCQTQGLCRIWLRKLRTWIERPP